MPEWEGASRGEGLCFGQPQCIVDGRAVRKWTRSVFGTGCALLLLLELTAEGKSKEEQRDID